MAPSRSSKSNNSKSNYSESDYGSKTEYTEEGSASEMSESEEEEEEWTNDHLKLLYMISKYAECATSADEDESWIRKNSLLVLIYEGIVEGVFDYDYAPMSLLVGRKRVWLNITQEGKDDIDDLREGGLLSGLKLSSEDLQPITAFQVSAKGKELAILIPKEFRTEVDNLVYHKNELKQVRFEERTDKNGAALKGPDGDDLEPVFILSAEGEEDGEEWDWQEDSSITDTEDVSYVSSPYLPNCLRGFGPDTKDNSGRAHESAAGASGVKDELDENIILRHLDIIVGEWIPFGANQIVALNEKLGAADRCQGGMFTGELDTDSTSTSFKVEPGLTKVSILDFNDTRFTNFEAEINFPEDEGIIQVEEFGMHYGVEGKVLYGMHLEAIGDRKGDDVSVDNLARVLVDVHLDSSKITKDLISKYQSTLLDCAFMDDALQRDKFNMLIAEGIEPKMEASRYLDKEDNECELKQVLGDTQGAFNLTPDDVMITGKSGMLIVGPNSKKHEDLLVLYLQLHSRNMFLKVFFTRTFVLGDELRRLRDMIVNHEKDPTTVNKVRERLSKAARHIILMTETLGYLEDSLKQEILAPIPAPDDLCGKEMHRILNNDFLIHNLKKRVRDMQKNVVGASNELTNLTRMTDVINTKQLEDVYKGVEKNTKALVDASAAKERASASLEIMQVVFAASMAFDLVDKFTALDLNTNLAPWQLWIEIYIIRPPGMWFACNITWMLFMCWCLKKLMAHLGDKSLNFLTFEVALNMKIDADAFKEYLDTKDLLVSDGQLAEGVINKSAIWEEDDELVWEGAAPALEVSYDVANGFLLVVQFTIDRKLNPKTEVELKDIFINQLAVAGVCEIPEDH